MGKSVVIGKLMMGSVLVMMRVTKQLAKVKKVCICALTKAKCNKMQWKQI